MKGLAGLVWGLACNSLLSSGWEVVRHFAHSAEYQSGWTRAQAVGSLQLCRQLRWEVASWAGQCFGAVQGGFITHRFPCSGSRLCF